MPVYYDDESPWLRRQLDALANRMYWRTSRGARGFVLGALNVVVLGPIWLVLDWWRRLRNTPSRVWSANLLMGLPAVAGAAIAAGVGYAAATQDWTVVATHLHQAAQRAETVGDRPTFLLALNRMREVDRTPGATMRLAQAYAADGRADDALALMLELTPLHDVGAPQAHRWFAQRYLDDQDYPQAADYARRHLERALEAPSQSTADLAGALVELGRLEAGANRFDKAAEAFEKALDLKHPDAALELGWLRLEQQRLPESRDFAQQALRYYEERTRLHSDDVPARALQAQATVLGGDFVGGVRALAQAREEARTPAERAALAEAYLRAGKCSPSPALRWEIWESAFLLDPHGAPILRHMVGAIGAVPGEWPFFDALLQHARNMPAAAPAAELLLGLSALNRRNPGATRAHFQRAQELDRGAPALLALLARRSALRPEALLGWTEAGLALWPADPELHYARGLARVAQGLPRDALADLDAAQALRGRDPAYQRLLAEVCEAIELHDRARTHRRSADAFLPAVQGAMTDVANPR